VALASATSPSRTFAMFEPMTLPTAISPFFAAANEPASSGRLVPMETMVRPMISSEMPAALVVSCRIS